MCDTTAIDTNELRESTRGIALTVIESLLGDAQPPSELPASQAQPALACEVCIEGPCHARVIVALSPRHAHWIASRMFGVSAANENADDAREAAREVSNMVAGNLKPLFGPGHNLGLPQDVTSPSTSAHSQLAHVRVEHHGDLLEVHVLQAA